MNIRIIESDLFVFKDTHDLVHCISSDFSMGAGIARSFAALGAKKLLFEKYPSYKDSYDGHGHALQTGHIWNLVTKARSWHKPTYKSLAEALLELKTKLEEKGVSRIAMPKIGCGLDKLSWENVYKLICKIFEKTEIDITVCVLNPVSEK